LRSARVARLSRADGRPMATKLSKSGPSSAIRSICS
jgi:hypothetical protein